jgi:hypothetical protein
MELLLAVEETLRTVEAADIRGRERRMLVKQALLDHFRERE